MLNEFLLLGAAVLAVVGLVQAISLRFALPQTILVALVGISFGAACLTLAALLPKDALAFVAPLVAWRLTPQTYLTLFLPVLLFQASLSVNVRNLVADAAPILLLAVFAVFVATGAIGYVASTVSGHPLVDSLLLGAVIATTDPSAVLAVFRSVGAPARLVQLIEGESLLNDAAAIAVAGALLAALGGQHGTSSAAGIINVFLVSFGGGALFGIAAGRVLAWALVHLGGEGKAELALTLALPYPLYIVGDQWFHVSGVVAVVAAGLMISGLGRTRLSPDNWTQLQLWWEQAAALAGALVFLIASIRVPALLEAATPADLITLAAVVLAALAARLLVLFGLFPLLSRLRLSQPVSPAYMLVIALGGLRGAVTIVLAMGIAEDVALPESTRRFVAVISTGFVLFSLMVNGPSLTPLIRKLKLNILPRQEQALQEQVVRIASEGVESKVEEAANVFEIDRKITVSVIARYRHGVAASTPQPDLKDTLTERERLTIGLITLARKERELIPNYGNGVISVSNLDAMMRNASRMIDAARQDGRLGYRRAAVRILALPWTYRLATWIHLHLDIAAPLGVGLANRFELLMCRRAVLEELRDYNRTRLAPLFGQRQADTLAMVLDARVTGTEAAINAMRTEFKDFTASLEGRMLLLVALREGRRTIAEMLDDRSISREIYDSLDRELSSDWKAAVRRPRLAAPAIAGVA